MVILIIIAFLVISFTVDALVKFSRQRKLTTKVMSEDTIRVFNQASVSVPNGIYYYKTHTWAFMEKNGSVKIGIDDFLLHITGKVNNIKMKEAGERILKGEVAFSIIQNGKQLTIKAPVSGIIKSKNNNLFNEPELLNSSTFNEGWVYTIEPTNWHRETNFLFMADTYKDWLKSEFVRLKDFFAMVANPTKNEFLPIILQEGGEIKENVLMDMSPEVWEEFQKKFMNN